MAGEVIDTANATIAITNNLDCVTRLLPDVMATHRLSKNDVISIACDLAIHQRGLFLWMDCRVKPGHDDENGHVTTPAHC
jgi:hypothetical protein